MLEKLAQQGSRRDRQLASTALESIKCPEKRAGRDAPTIVWGGEIERIDVSPQSLQIGSLNYNAVDFGDCIPLSNHLQKALGEPNKDETNQCVLLRLAGAFEWKSQNCPKRVPNRSRVNVVASECRQLEYQSALRFLGTLKTPQTQREHELWSVAHDAMTPNHDRQFRELAAFLPTALLRNGEVLRIYDIDESDGRIRISAHVYGEDRQGSIEHDLALCVWNGHMRCLFPTAIATLEHWKMWAPRADSVFSYEWKGWSAELEKDESAVTVYALEPC